MLRPRPLPKKAASKPPVAKPVQQRPEPPDQWAHLKTPREKHFANLERLGELLLKNPALADLPCDDTGLSNAEFLHASGSLVASYKIIQTCEHLDQDPNNPMFEGRSYYLLADIWKLGSVLYTIHNEQLVSDIVWDKLGRYLLSKIAILEELKIIPHMFTQEMLENSSGADAYALDKPKDKALVFFLNYHLGLKLKHKTRNLKGIKDGNAFESFVQTVKAERQPTLAAPRKLLVRPKPKGLILPKSTGLTIRPKPGAR